MHIPQALSLDQKQCHTLLNTNVLFFKTKNSTDVRDRICVDPPLCRGTSQGILGSRIIGPVCKSETVGNVGEVDEKGERELVLVRHYTWMTIVLGTQRCAILDLEPRVFA